MSESASAGHQPGSVTFEVPHDVAAEQIVLGAMLRSKDFIADVVETIHAEDFYRPAHERIHGAILALYAAGASRPDHYGRRTRQTP
ncbi:DnaB-like helicase N-terminal domain-containing protein [Kitasatospora sp. NPDC057904]|uniref:DnaB-like helicase N-terminal domain-containing protein n=1 Tax=Kitasatospora sp. NPDC057904 TaxID=3346275 RepID=UPI0036DF2E4D